MSFSPEQQERALWRVNNAFVDSPTPEAWAYAVERLERLDQAVASGAAQRAGELCIVSRNVPERIVELIETHQDRFVASLFDHVTVLSPDCNIYDSAVIGSEVTETAIVESSVIMNSRVHNDAHVQESYLSDQEVHRGELVNVNMDDNGIRMPIPA